MIRFAAWLLGVCALNLLVAAPIQAQPFQIDPVHSAVLFKVKHMNTSYAFGRFNDMSGTVDLDGPQPTITFKSTKITKTGDTHYNVAGELTLHGVTKPIEVVVERTGQGLNLMGKKILGVSSEFRIQRADYGMKHLVGPVAGDVDLQVSLECVAP